MKVERPDLMQAGKVQRKKTSSAKKGSEVANKTPTTAVKGSAKAPSAPVKVSISNAGSVAGTASQRLKEVSSAKVADLTEKIQNGNYNPSASDIANAMMDFVERNVRTFGVE